MFTKLTVHGLILLSFFSLSALAQERKFEFDDNGDGIIDSIYRYEGGVLVEHLNDRNYDQKFDYQLKVSGPITIIEIDNNFDAKFDRFEEIKNRGNESDYTVYKIINGKKELLHHKIITNVEERDNFGPCEYDQYLDGIETLERFTSDFRFVVSEMNGGFSPDISGLRVHKSCFKNFKEEKFSKMLTNAVNDGLACLTEIAKENTQETMKGEIFNLINHFKIQMSGEVKPISLICHEKKHKWSEGEIAHASINMTKATGLDIEHPYVSLNPKMKKSFFGGIKNGPPTAELEGIIFHEMIHNFGYMHGVGVDITYGCEVCCFSGNSRAKKSACNICVSNYKDEYDPKYLMDVAQMSRETRLASGEIFFYKNLAKVPVNQESIDALFVALSVRGPGVQTEFLELLKSRGLKVSDNEHTKDSLRDLKRYRPPTDYIKAVGEVYARALVEVFIDKNVSKARRTLFLVKISDLEEVEAKHRADSNEAGILKRGLRYLFQLI